jgi:hypothetical protein
MVVIGLSAVFGGEGKKFESFQDRAGGGLPLRWMPLCNQWPDWGLALMWDVGIGRLRLELAV